MRIEKIQLLDEISVILKGSDYLYLITYKGLNVKEFSQLRDNLAAQNASCMVLKNRFIKKAAEKAGLDGFSNLDLTGSTALISGSGDPGAVAKVISTFGEDCEAVTAKGGYLDGAVLTENDVKEIASLPSREALLGQLLGVIEAPSRNLVGVLNTKATEILNILNAYKNSKED